MPWTKLVAKLKADRIITGYVGRNNDARIYTGLRHYADALPAIVINRIAATPVNHAGGTTNMWAEEVELLCIADTFAVADALSHRVRKVLNGWRDNRSGTKINMCHLSTWSNLPEDLEPGEHSGIHAIPHEYRIECHE